MQMTEGTVLVVDDNPAIRGMLADALHACGYTVVEAADGQEALDVAQLSQPALILLDLNLPIISGFSFVNEIQSRGVDAPILLVTADPRAPKVAGGEQIVGYVAKPFEIDSLLGAVESALRGEPLPMPQPEREWF
jgi:two-component system OmpR family response regulator